MKTKQPTAQQNNNLRIGLIIPHIFMQRDILPNVIFAPAELGLDLVEGLMQLDAHVTLFTPGPVHTKALNLTADLRNFETELKGRGDTYLDLLKKHPLTFISLARQVQSELIAKAFSMANDDQFDILHIYTNEEDIALPFVSLCKKPVVLTHHDPFNFLVKYKSIFPKYAHLNWLSMSMAQRQGMPSNTNWVGNIYHGLKPRRFSPIPSPKNDYLAYLGRIIQPKGVHLAIKAVRLHNQLNPQNKLKLKIAGKHYASTQKDTYWQEQIAPEIDSKEVEYLGFLSNDNDKQEFLGNAIALMMPSLFQEPFGMVTIEALACGTPVIGLDSGAIPEIIKNNQTGYVIERASDESTTIKRMSAALSNISSISRKQCRQDFETRFTLDRMCSEHLQAYRNLLTK
jgi:glycosyltransferase involved in cell wall biosynthesis